MPSDAGKGDIDRVERELAKRRGYLRLSWTRIADSLGMSEQNLLRVRRGKVDLSDHTAFGLDRALLWPPGTVRAIHTNPTFIPPMDRFRYDDDSDQAPIVGLKHLTAHQVLTLLEELLTTGDESAFWTTLRNVAKSRAT